MKKQIHRTQVSLYSKKLHDLGIDSEEWCSYIIVLNKVSSWREYVDENDEIDHSKTVVYCSSDMESVIRTPYKEFDKLMVEYLED